MEDVHVLEGPQKIPDAFKEALKQTVG
jgi:hypothetical protein